MSTSVDAGEPPAAASLHENAAKILMYLSTQENERASTPALRDATGLSAANISGHHALTLIEKGYIEKTGKKAGDAPKDANVYTLTHRGRKEAKRLLKTNEAPMTDEERDQKVRQLQDRVDELEAILERGEISPETDDDLVEQVEENTTRLNQVEAALNDAGDTLDAVVEKVF